MLKEPSFGSFCFRFYKNGRNCPKYKTAIAQRRTPAKAAASRVRAVLYFENEYQIKIVP
jgi:hypothetical protein